MGVKTNKRIKKEKNSDYIAPEFELIKLHFL